MVVEYGDALFAKKGVEGFNRNHLFPLSLSPGPAGPLSNVPAMPKL